MHMIAGVLQYVAVASFAEAWIENIWNTKDFGKYPSPPSRRRGLKKRKEILSGIRKIVASFAEAWIENTNLGIVIYLLKVASFAEAWIEKKEQTSIIAGLKSPPSRRRGLKKQCVRKF